MFCELIFPPKILITPDARSFPLLCKLRLFMIISPTVGRKQSSSSFSSCSTSSELPGPAPTSAKSLASRPGLSSSSLSLASPRRLTSGPEVKNQLSPRKSSGARNKRQSHLADIQSDGGESDEVSDAETEIIGTGSVKPVICHEGAEVKRRVTSAGSSRGGQQVTR